MHEWMEKGSRRVGRALSGLYAGTRTGSVKGLKASSRKFLRGIDCAHDGEYDVSRILCRCDCRKSCSVPKGARMYLEGARMYLDRAYPEVKLSVVQTNSG